MVATQTEPLKLVRVKLNRRQRIAAFDKVTAWLQAWQRQAWAEMARRTQLPPGVEMDAPEMCERLAERLAENTLESFEVRRMEIGVGGMVGRECVAFADFPVVAVVRGVRVGILVRAILLGGKWYVNFTSINRRFKPDEGK